MFGFPEGSFQADVKAPRVGSGQKFKVIQILSTSECYVLMCSVRCVKKHEHNDTGTLICGCDYHDSLMTPAVGAGRKSLAGILLEL